MILSPVDVEAYRRKGYAALRGLLDPDEIANLQEECDRLWTSADLSPGNLRAVARPTTAGGRQIDRLDPVSDLSPLIARIVRAPKLLAAAAAVLGEPAVLMKDKLIFKSAGVHGYTVHQDYHVWQEMPVPAEALLTIALAVDATHAANGAVQFYPGLHDRLHTERCTPSDLFSPSSGVVPEPVLAGVEPELIPLSPGDAVIFSSLVPHESAPNLTGDPRRVLFLTYNAASYGDIYDAYYSKFQSYLRADRAAEGIQAPYFR